MELSKFLIWQLSKKLNRIFYNKNSKITEFFPMHVTFQRVFINPIEIHDELVQINPSWTICEGLSIRWKRASSGRSVNTTIVQCNGAGAAA